MSDALLPASATAAERALSEAVARISDVNTRSREIWSPALCDADLLPWLAWAFGVDDWSSDWTEAQKRGAIRNSVAVHRRKGTIGAVTKALAGLGLGVRVQEWFNQVPEGPEYTFRLLLEVDQIGITQQAIARILQVVESTKNLRSHLDTIIPGITTNANVYIGGAALVGTEVTVKYAPPVGSPLTLDGTWWLDGSQDLDGVRN
jgi:phage tail P2-like protein